MEKKHIISFAIVFIIGVAWVTYVSLVIDPKRDAAYTRPCLDAYGELAPCPQ